MLWILVGVLAVGAVLSAWLFVRSRQGSPAIETFSKTFDTITDADKLPSSMMRELVFGAQPVALDGGTRTINGIPNMWFTYTASTPSDELFTEYDTILSRMGWTVLDSERGDDTASFVAVKNSWPNPKPMVSIDITGTPVGSRVGVSVDNLFVRQTPQP